MNRVDGVREGVPGAGAELDLPSGFDGHPAVQAPLGATAERGISCG